MFSRPGVYLLFACLFVIALALWTNNPPKVVPADAPDSLFSALRAFRFVEEIGKAPHTTGTAENHRVRKYIVSQCREFGLDVEVQHTTAVSRRGRPASSTVLAANVYNVVARMKGSRGSGKCLLVMSHYDTQPNAPGAGDDGSSVAAMLETARMLSKRGHLQNDVVFLFTDAEEVGMLGAVGFVQDSARVKEVGLLLNFDNRGNGGVTNMFEVNSKNGWAVKHYIQGARYPFGSSLGYEIYKLLPNYTDFTVFRQAGVTGLNSAFIGGFVNYHSPNDKPGNLDLRSLQQHGGNMLSLIRHFGNIPLEQTKEEDVTFFNIAGYWIVSHPASWNLPLVVACIALLLTYLTMTWQKKLLSIKGFFAGLSVFIVTLIVLLLATVFLAKGITSVYPSYKNFYANNSYNISNYHLAFTAFAILTFTRVYRWLLKKFDLHSLLAAILTTQVIILALLYSVVPTAVFILLYPLLFCTGGNILLLLNPGNTTTRSAILMLSLLPALWWLPPTISQMFVVFGLSGETGGVIAILGLLLGMMLPVFHILFNDLKNFVAWACLFVFVTSLLSGHLQSGYSPEKPLQSYLTYVVDASGKARWSTSSLDEWNRQFFQTPEYQDRLILNSAPPLPYATPLLEIRSDSTSGASRFLSFHCSAREEAIGLSIDFGRDNPALDVAVEGPGGSNGNVDRRRSTFVAVHYAGLDSTGFDMSVETLAGKPLEITLTDRSIGLPLSGSRSYPPHVVPGTGFDANTVQVTKKVVLN